MHKTLSLAAAILYHDMCISFLIEYSVFRYGFSNMRYIASLISGVGIFMMGAGLSWYHGIMGLLHPEPIESLLWVIAIIHLYGVYE